jgi:hypothetical protein
LFVGPGKLWPTPINFLQLMAVYEHIKSIYQALVHLATAFLLPTSDQVEVPTKNQR